MEYSKERLLKNLDYLIDIRKLKISDLEKSCNISIGYFSRFKQPDSQEYLSLQLLISLSNYLNVSINDLLFCDCTKLINDEILILNFLTTLINKTHNDEIEWKELRLPNALSTIEDSGIELLFDKEKLDNDYYFIKSRFYTNIVSLTNGSLYVCSNGSEKFVIYETGFNTRPFEHLGYEFCVIKNEKIYPLLNDENEKIVKELRDRFHTLVKEIDTHVNRVRLDLNIKNTILEYK